MMITKQDLISGFKELGLEKGDEIFVTSSLSRFGDVEDGAEAVIEALRECVEGGSIIMPSFNFSIFKEKEIILDILNTPSEMGIITEIFRKQTKRTSNPFHPLSYEGKIASEIELCQSYDTWGEGSAYELMAKRHVKMVMLGTDFYSCPICHYAEQKNNVPYREPIEYEGSVIDKTGKKSYVRCRRLRRKYGDVDNNRIDLAFSAKFTMIGNSVCRSFDIADLVSFFDIVLNETPNYLLSENRLLSPMLVMPKFNMMSAIKKLFDESRYLVSDGFSNSIDYLRRFIPLRIEKWKSGEKVETWTIPKKWTPDGEVDGELIVGNWLVKGFTNKEILLPIHLDHPFMANDNLSGVAVAVELALRLARTSDLKYSYRFLFLPETIGTMAYLSRYWDRYSKNPPMLGIVIDSVGTKNNLVVIKTKFSSMFNSYIKGETNEFLSDAHLWTGNDERVLECWGIPAIQFSRSPFNQYHSFKDTPDIIEESKLWETVETVYNYILRLENDFIPKPLYRGVPCLSSVGLWEQDLGLEKIYHLIGYGLSIGQIAQMIDMPFDYVYDFVLKMEKAGLIGR